MKINSELVIFQIGLSHISIIYKIYLTQFKLV